MKYRVIGWTNYDDESTPDKTGCLGFAERNAIIDDIRAHGYLFSGWDHQEMWDCTPILNDGKKRCYSQRSWGGIMAEAYGCTGAYDYSRFTFSESLDREKCVYPKSSNYPRGFTPETDLNEHFTVLVEEGLFALAEKRNPFFLEDLDALRYIDAGDTLTLVSGERRATYFVTDIDRNRNTTKPDAPYTIRTKFKILVTHSGERGEEENDV